MVKKLRNSKSLYWWLIGTFGLLYACVGFVSTLHSITFFELANTMWLAILLGVTYEVGQAAVLFSILMSKNNQTMLAWGLMILLTALQVTANVYASFKFMDSSGVNDWEYWQRSILFWMEADPEMFKVVISWISGALLPVVALGMTSLVAENIKLKDEDEEKDEKPVDDIIIDEKPVDKVIYDTVESDTNLQDSKEINRNKKLAEKLKAESKDISLGNEEERLEGFRNAILKGEETPYEKLAKENIDGVIEERKPIELLISPSKEDIMANFANTLEYDIESIDVSGRATKLDTTIQSNDIMESDIPEIKLDVSTKEVKVESFKLDASGNIQEKLPLVRGRGWHLKKEYIDSNGDVYHFGKYQPNIHVEIPNEIKKEVGEVAINEITEDSSKKA